jgi:hypothetical protein
MVELREPWYRSRTALLILIVVLGAGLVYVTGRWTAVGPSDELVWRECGPAYARAKTKADSAAIDQRRPVIGRTQATSAVSCGLLRKSRANSDRGPAT